MVELRMYSRTTEHKRCSELGCGRELQRQSKSEPHQNPGPAAKYRKISQIMQYT